MTITPTYTGDLILSLNTDFDWDLNYINGQPEMTDGFDTAVILSVFVEPDTWQNGLTDDPSEKYISEFSSVIKNGRVDDDTLKAGTATIKKALKWMVDIKAAESVEVTGGVLNVFGLYWTVVITKGNIVSRYTINWDKGVITVAGLPIFEARPIPARFHNAQLNPSLEVQINPSGEIQLYEFTE